MTGNLVYLVAAYAVFVLSIAGLGLSVRARRRRVEREISRVEREISRVERETGTLEARQQSERPAEALRSEARVAVDGEVPVRRPTG